jgi:hypothetical protein
MLEFQGKDAFAAFLINGFSLVVTGGALSKIAAAAIFVVTRDGVFIDAIAASHGRAPDMCKLSRSTHVGTDNGQRSLIDKSDNGSFQHCGLGSFLLVEHCATFVCTHPEASFFLRSNSSRLEFYENRGFASLPSGASLPHEFLKVVPSANFATIESDDTSLFSKPMEVLRLRGNGLSSPHKKQTAYKTTGAKKAELKRKLASARPSRKGKPPADGESAARAMTMKKRTKTRKRRRKCRTLMTYLWTAASPDLVRNLGRSPVMKRGRIQTSSEKQSRPIS